MTASAFLVRSMERRPKLGGTMKLKTLTFLSLLLALSLALATPASAVTVDVRDSTGPWLGFMNWTDLDNSPADDGASGWGVSDLVATFDDANSKLTLSPNTIDDPDPYWYPNGPGTPGGKTMEANLYIEETGPLAGQTVTFVGSVLADTVAAGYDVNVFIKDFAPDYSSNVGQVVALSGPGPFSISLATDADPARHVQYGFQYIGPNIWPDNTEELAAAGNMMVATIPEPSTFALVGLCLAGLFGFVRRR